MPLYPVLQKIMVALIIIAAAVFFYIYSSVFMPILLALLTAVIFEPFVKVVQKYTRTVRRWPAVTLVFTTFVLSGSIAVYVTITRIIDQIIITMYQLPRYALEIQFFVEQSIHDFHVLIEDFPQRHLLIREVENQMQLMTDKAYEAAREIILTLTGWVQAIPNTVFIVIVYLITLFLFSLDLPRIVELFYRLFKEETANKIKYVFQRLGKVFWGYWKAQFLLSIMIFVLCYLSLIFIAPDVALLMTVIIWVVDIIPLYVGPAIILVPWAIYEFIAGTSATGIQLLILALVLLIIRRITEPKVLGDQMGLSALATVLSMYFGFYFFGVMGLILGPFVLIAIRSAIEAGMFKFDFKI